MNCLEEPITVPNVNKRKIPLARSISFTITTYKADDAKHGQPALEAGSRSPVKIYPVVRGQLTEHAPDLASTSTRVTISTDNSLRLPSGKSRKHFAQKTHLHTCRWVCSTCLSSGTASWTGNAASSYPRRCPDHYTPGSPLSTEIHTKPSPFSMYTAGQLLASHKG
jgi:hypothetical protein